VRDRASTAHRSHGLHPPSLDPPALRVVVAIDMSDQSPRVLRRALMIANTTPGSEVHVALVVDPPAVGLAPETVMTVETSSDSLPQLTEYVDAEAKALAAHIGPLQIGKITAHLLTGAPAREIVWLAAHLEVDLIVLGTHGRTGIKRALLGSVAERVVRTAGCPVFVDRPTHHDPSAHEPEVIPLCAACKERREATGGKELWCAHHQQHHAHGHIYSGPQMSTGSASSPFSFSS
jgi:nucleotide-binding universal stress UspA family protein